MKRTMISLFRLKPALLAVCLACSFTAAYAVVPQDAPPQLVLVDAPASYLGVNIRDVTLDSAKMLGLKSTQGVEVIAVDHDAPAGKAGIHLRDVIITVDGKAVTSARQFRETMRGLPPDRIVSLGVLRDARPMKFDIKLADRAKLQHQAFLQHFNVPMPEVGNTFRGVVAMQNDLGDGDAIFSDDTPEFQFPHPFRIGATLDPIGPQLAAFFGVKDGTGLLVKSVEQGGPASVAGLQAGDVILKVNDDSIVTPVDWLRAMQNAQGKPIQLTIVRNKHVEVVTIPPPKTQAKLELPPLPPLQLDDSRIRSQMENFKDQPGSTDKAMSDAQADLPDSKVLQARIGEAMRRLRAVQQDCCGSLQPY